MPKQFDVAVIGGETLVAETLLTLLAEREFPVGQLYALTDESEVGNDIAFGQRQVELESIAHFNFDQVQIVFSVTDSKIAAQYITLATHAGCVVIDTQSSLYDDVPLVIPELNPQDIAKYAMRNIISSPDAITIQMMLALKPIDDRVGIERINVCTYQAVSGEGKNATEELAKQTADLLSFKPIKCQVYPKQVAFNVLPQVGVLEDNGYTSTEIRVMQEVKQFLGKKSLAINMTAVTVPVFYGHSAAIHIDTTNKIDIIDVEELLKQAQGMELLDQMSLGGYPTAVTESSGNDVVFVGRIRQNISHPKGLDMWVVSDNLRKGAALNSIQIAEILAKDYLSTTPELKTQGLVR